MNPGGLLAFGKIGMNRKGGIVDMAVKKSAGRVSSPAVEAEPTKAELQRRMEEAREDISQTVEEIKDTVTESYEAVKETVVETLDWREQFRKHPGAWSLGALSIGYVIGTSLMASLKDSKHEDQLLKHLAALSENFTDELSKRGMDLLMPALTGTVLMPMLTGKIKEMFGIDLSDFSKELLSTGDVESAADVATKGGKKRKKAGGKKNGKHRKGGKRRKADQS
jgi:hypothetical protein